MGSSAEFSQSCPHYIFVYMMLLAMASVLYDYYIAVRLILCQTSYFFYSCIVVTQNVPERCAT